LGALNGDECVDEELSTESLFGIGFVADMNFFDIILASMIGSMDLESNVMLDVASVHTSMV